MKANLPNNLVESARLGHMPALDGLRGLAILVVMFHHFLPPNYPIGIPGGLEGFIIKVLYRFCDIGWWGVDLFFVLSGFLITGILLADKSSPHYFRNFYIRRSLRIFPLYYGLLIGLFIIVPALARQPFLNAWLKSHLATFLEMGTRLAPLQGWLWLYGVNVKTALESHGWIFHPLTHFWTLAIEEHFYLVWPLIVYLVSPKGLVRLCLALAFLAIVFRAAFLYGGLAPAYVFLLTPCRLDSLVLGGAMAVLYRSSAREAIVESCRRAFRYLLPISVLAILTLNRFGSVMIIIGFTMLAATFAAALPLVASLKKQETTSKKTKWLFNPVLGSFGKFSYGIYVIHPFIIAPLGRFLDSPVVRSWTGNGYAVQAFLRISFGAACALLLGYLSWHLFEKHFMKLKQFFPTNRILIPVNAIEEAGLEYKFRKGIS